MRRSNSFLLVSLALAGCGDAPAAMCINSSDCAPMERCVDAVCIAPTGMDGATDTGIADTGRGEDTGDGAPPCTAAECDDGNECTDDRCTTSGCQSSDNASACDDGLFCNGPDTCALGACDVHAGDPCGALTCSESTGACDGECSSVIACPADIIGAWSSCAGFSDPCDRTGTRTRDVATFTCTSTACVVSSMAESGDCTRVTNGTVCDDGVPCTFADTCSSGACAGRDFCGRGCTCIGRSDLCFDDRSGDPCVAD